MKKGLLLLVAFATLFATTTSAQWGNPVNSCLPTLNSSTGDMPRTIQELIRNSESVVRIGKLPNGDIIFFVSSPIKTESVLENLNEKKRVVKYDDTPEQALIIYSKLFRAWKMFGYWQQDFSRENQWLITNPKITSQWEVSVEFKKGKEKVDARYSFETESFLFNSVTDQEKVEQQQIPYVLIK